MNFGWSNGTFGMLDFDGLEGAALEAAQAECVLAKIGSAIAWIFAPLGWMGLVTAGRWQLLLYPV